MIRAEIRKILKLTSPEEAEFNGMVKIVDMFKFGYIDLRTAVENRHRRSGRTMNMLVDVLWTLSETSEHAIIITHSMSMLEFTRKKLYDYASQLHIDASRVIFMTKEQADRHRSCPGEIKEWKNVFYDHVSLGQN